MGKEENVNNKKRSCNLIIIGNGFDLLIGLPTRFSNFIDFCMLYNKFVECIDMPKHGVGTYDFNSKLDEDGVLIISEDLLKNFPCTYGENEKIILKSLINKIDNSKLIKHCIMLKKDKNYKWKDFEKYLLFLCESFEEYITNISDLKEINQNVNFINTDLKMFIEAMGLNKGCFDFNVSNPYRKVDTSTFLRSSLSNSRMEFVNVIRKELLEFNEIFNIYIKLFICNIPIIHNIKSFENDNSNNYIINFNYTWNEQLLGPAKYNHPHGITIDDNIIIGIDSDDLPIEYICLQKKFLSINNRIDSFFNIEKDKNYYDLEEWIGECKHIDENNYSVIVIGHSLNSIDDYILKKIFNNPLLGQVLLYYHSEESKIALLSNICRIMGYDKVERMLIGFPHIVRRPIQDLLYNKGII